MLDVKVSEHGCRITASGSVSEILADITVMINDLYGTMAKQDKVLSAVFRENLTRAVTDPESTAWTQTPFGTGFMVTMPGKQEG